MILGITPISHAFQVPKCVIKAHDPRLRCISIVVEGFLLPEGAPIPEGTFSTQPILFPGPTTEGTQSSTPILEGIPKVGASSSQQFTETATLSRTKNSKEEEVVEMTDSEDEFEVFNKDLSPETSVTDLDPHFSPIIDEMGIQRKPKSTLLALIENQPRRDASRKTVHSKSPTLPPTLPSPQLVDLKRKREPKQKEVMEAGQTLPPRRDKVQRASKQAKIGQREAAKRSDP